MPSLFGAVGNVFTAVVISVCSAFMQPLQCDLRPNGFSTMQTYRQVICRNTEDSHQHGRVGTLPEGDTVFSGTFGSEHFASRDPSTCSCATQRLTLSRLLMVLMSHAAHDVFLDSDNLPDPSLPFCIVSNKTETLIVLSSRDVLHRPSSVGEVTMTRLHDIDTILVVFPNFQHPILHCHRKLCWCRSDCSPWRPTAPASRCAQKTLWWISPLPRIVLPRVISLAVVDAVVEKRRASSDRTLGETQAVILVVWTALLVKDLLNVGAEVDLRNTAATLLVMSSHGFSEGEFRPPVFSGWCLQYRHDSDHRR